MREIEKEIVKKVGVDLELATPKYLQVDNLAQIQFSNLKGVEVLSTKDALKKYDWLKKYFWKAVEKEKDEFTKFSAEHDFNGYFIRIGKNVKAKIPVQACLFLNTEGFIQNIHNIIIAEENSEISIITGCTVASHKSGMHIGISEFFLGKNSKVNFTMIHAWNEETEVMPRTGAIVGKNAKFSSNYILLTPTKKLQMAPKIINLENSSSSLRSLLFGKKKSFVDVGGIIEFKGRNSSGIIQSRVVAKEKAKVISRGEIVAEAPETRGHIECKGLILSNEASIEAIPKLFSKNKKSELTHEASVGKIRDEELWYLMSRGLSEEEAVNLIMKGFLDPDFLEIPENVKVQIRAIMEETKASRV
jgi:Fe-S cluster assembly scaffold protein SufB